MEVQFGDHSLKEKKKKKKTCKNGDEIDYNDKVKDNNVDITCSN